MSEPHPEPDHHAGGTKELFLAYLDYYRSTIARKLTGLSDTELKHTRLPSGWTPLELLCHLVHMERRWLRWGFMAEPVETPWGDLTTDSPRGAGVVTRWCVPEDATLDGLIDALHQGGERTRRIVEAAELDQLAETGGRFADDPPSLVWILFHVMQEYVRHAGHVDIVRELADGELGE